MVGLGFNADKDPSLNMFSNSPVSETVKEVGKGLSSKDVQEHSKAEQEDDAKKFVVPELPTPAIFNNPTSDFSKSFRIEDKEDDTRNKILDIQSENRAEIHAAAKHDSDTTQIKEQDMQVSNIQKAATNEDRKNPISDTMIIMLVGHSEIQQGGFSNEEKGVRNVEAYKELVRDMVKNVLEKADYVLPPKKREEIGAMIIAEQMMFLLTTMHMIYSYVEVEGTKESLRQGDMLIAKSGAQVALEMTRGDDFVKKSFPAFLEYVKRDPKLSKLPKSEQLLAAKALAKEFGDTMKLTILIPAFAGMLRTEYADLDNQQFGKVFDQAMQSIMTGEGLSGLEKGNIKGELMKEIYNIVKEMTPEGLQTVVYAGTMAKMTPGVKALFLDPSTTLLNVVLQGKWELNKNIPMKG